MSFTNDPHTPRAALRFLKWFCPAHLYEEIEGDLMQRFHRDERKWGTRQARRQLLWNAIRFFRPGILLRNKFSLGLNPFYMVSHFFTIFFRTTLRNKSYSLINIAGLAMGLCCSIFILLWVIDEVTFDPLETDKDRIFKIMGNHAFPDGTSTWEETPGPLATALKQFPEVSETCRLALRVDEQLLLHYKEKSFYEAGAYADPTIFNVFTIPFVSGNPAKALSDNQSVVISQKIARKYFGEEDPIGKVFRINSDFDAKVTGVFFDLPANATFQFDFILPYDVYAKTDPYTNEWGAWTGGLSFVKLGQAASIGSVNALMHEHLTKPHIWERWDKNVTMFLFPMTSWRLHDSFKDGKQDGGRITYVVGFSLVAVFILFIACVNFMNMATARSINRMKEIGVRKVVGAGRRSLIGQFMSESVLTAFLSLVIALLFIHLLLPGFNTMTGKQLGVDYLNLYFTGSLLGITLLTGLLAGSYPAFLLSSFRPAQIFKGTLSALRGGALRRTLVVFQFGTSVVLIVCAIAVYRQIDYMRTKNLGFDKDNVFYFRSNEHLRKSFDSFRQALMQNPVLINVAQSEENPMEIFSGIVLADNAWPGKTKEDNIAFRFLQGDENLLPTLGFTFVDGRNFSAAFPSDSSNYIISEEAARRMKLADPVGQQLIAPRKGNIIGVIKDFHSTGLKGPVEPVIIAMRPQDANRIFLRYQPGKLEEAMNHLKNVFLKFEPDFPLQYTFLDDTFGRQYQSEIMLGKLAACFTGLAIFISCLGLFGLASFTAEKRTKEIGVRKIMGASVSELMLLLCKDVVGLVVIALVIGLPIAAWLIQEFLSGYTFHTETGIGVFLITAGSMLILAILTVSWQSARAALANPVNCLKSE